MKQRIERLEDQQGAVESPINCVILVPMQEHGTKQQPLAALSGYGITVQRLIGETDPDFESRAAGEIRKNQETGLLVLSGSY
ncbi:hypothetical protein [Herbaspirillum frisingense]|uniref:hypothetical protein n=1 Tax=Herbaspirillum frisingense TaxID=92645 RepID=UPI001F2EBC72|nr:hypothetical protein [Herbaspirillum frisingense]UIN20796.1 hypothetical protein LAZ82_20355 [Herbaspirillum frisingense]